MTSCTGLASPLAPLLHPPLSFSLHPALTRRSRAASMLPLTARVSARRSQPVSSRLSERAAKAPEETKAILKATAQLAGDRGLAKAVDKKLKKGLGITQAVHDAVEDYAQMLRSLGGYMAERATDLYDVRDRAICELRGLPEPGVPAFDGARRPGGARPGSGRDRDPEPGDRPRYHHRGRRPHLAHGDPGRPAGHSRDRQGRGDHGRRGGHRSWPSTAASARSSSLPPRTRSTLLKERSLPPGAGAGRLDRQGRDLRRLPRQAPGQHRYGRRRA